jgi:hypothetical protein
VAGDEVRVAAVGTLAFATAHRLVVDGGVDGLGFVDGRYLGDHEELAFTTSPANAARITVRGDEPPVVTTVTPIVFDRPMFQPSLNTTTITATSRVGTGPTTDIEGAVAVSADDPFSAVFNPLPTYVAGTTVTLSVAVGALDFLGNPLPAPTTVTWVGIQGAPAGNARDPGKVDATSVTPAPGAGAVVAAQAFTLTLPTNNLSKLENRMLPASFNSTSVRLVETCGTAPATTLATTNRLQVATAQGGSESVTITPSRLLRTGCRYALTLSQRFFSNIHTIGPTGTGTDPFTLTYDVETVRPTVSSTDVTNARGHQPWTIRFSEPVALASLQNVVVVDGAVDVPGAWTTVGADAVFTPAGFWRTGRTYSVTFPTTVTDLAGNALATATTRTLRTETTAPVVPTQATVSGDELLLTFDEPLDPGSVRATTFGPLGVAGTIRVTDAAGDPVIACVHVDGAVVTLGHLGAAPGTALSITVTSGVTDSAGNAAAERTITANRP